MSISPILLLSICSFFHYCQLFSYYSILFTSVVNCLEPWIYAWLSLFQTTHDLRFKDLGRCLWLKWGDSKQHIHVLEMVLKTLQPTVCALKGYQWYHNKSEWKLKTAEETTLIIPLTSTSVTCFLTIIIKFWSCSQPFPCIHYRSTAFLTFNTFTSAIGPYFPSFVQQPLQDQHARGTSHRINMQEELLTGSTCMRNFSQDQHAWGTPFRINMHEELFTGWTCTRNFSKDQHARGTSHRDQNARGTSHRINMQEELLTGSTCKRNFLQNQHARGPSDLPMVVLA